MYVVLEQGSQDVLSFQVWDEDISEHEFIIGMGGTDAQWLSVVRNGGGTTLNDRGSSFTMIVEPL